MVKSRLPLISPGGVLYSRATRLRATHDCLTIAEACLTKEALSNFLQPYEFQCVFSFYGGRQPRLPAAVAPRSPPGRGRSPVARLWAARILRGNLLFTGRLSLRPGRFVSHGSGKAG